MKKGTITSFADNTRRGRNNNNGKDTPKDLSREEMDLKERIERYNVDMGEHTKKVVIRRGLVIGDK